MTSLGIRILKVINIAIIIIGVVVGGFLLLFGVANLVNPDVPDAYLPRNTKVCLVVCIIGILFLLLAIAAFRGILFVKKSDEGGQNT
jgi:hypothetical protein